MNVKGIESAPFHLMLSSIILLLTALLIFPAYGRWQDSMDLGRAKAEAGKILSAVELVHSIGDIGSVQQVLLSIPEDYRIAFGNESVEIWEGNATVVDYPLEAELRYRGSVNLTGPGRYYLTVVYWVRDDSTNKGKEFILEVFDR